MSPTSVSWSLRQIEGLLQTIPSCLGEACLSRVAQLMEGVENDLQVRKVVGCPLLQEVGVRIRVGASFRVDASFH